MKEHPIIFSTDMVKALLDGIKTQTRRVIKPQPTLDGQLLDFWTTKGRWRGTCIVTETNGTMLCPYGGIGDRLWVRETWAIKDCGRGVKVDEETWAEGYPFHRLQYIATDEPPTPNYWWNKRPSIFMPRWASRITLEITEVRVERLKEISVDDAIAEGCVPELNSSGKTLFPARGMFKALWDSLNAERGYGWEINPWVWVISFKVG